MMELLQKRNLSPNPDNDSGKVEQREKIQERTLDSLYESFPEKSKRFYTMFFESGARETHDRLGLYPENFKQAVLHYDVEGNISGATMYVEFPENTKTFDGRVHGGNIGAVFDAVMGIPIGFARLLPAESIVVALEVTTKIKEPVPTGEYLTLEIKCDKVEEERKFWMSVELKKDDKVLATGSSFYYKIPLPEESTYLL